MRQAGSSSVPSARTAAERRALVALSLVPGVGPGRLRALVTFFGSAVAARRARPRALAAVPGIGPRTAAAVAAFDDERAVASQFALARRCGATLVTADDPRFPPLLRRIYDPPPFLWVRGSLEEADARSVAVVGTRRSTEYGRRWARRFAAALAARGLTVVSGLAHGIDAAAHRGALEAGGRTLAVLGSGVDCIYPPSHAGLAREVTASGALLAEYAMGAPPDAPNFPRRNRLVSGLSMGTLVVEAHETGGALITARMAIEQNREVFALPSPVHSAAGVGCNRLIQRGHAKLVMGVDDLLEELEMYLPPAPRPVKALPDDLDRDARRLFEALPEEPLPLDDLCRRTGLDPSTALVHLLMLEFRGLVGQLAGKQFFRI